MHLTVNTESHKDQCRPKNVPISGCSNNLLGELMKSRITKKIDNGALVEPLRASVQHVDST